MYNIISHCTPGVLKNDNFYKDQSILKIAKIDKLKKSLTQSLYYYSNDGSL